MAYRILVVCQRYWPENMKLIDICEGLVERDVRVDVLCGQPYFKSVHKSKIKKYKERHLETHGGVRIIRCYEKSRENNASLNIFLNYVSFRLSSVRKLKQIKDREYDAIFIYQVSPVTMCEAGIRLGKMLEIPVTMFVADLWPHSVLEELDVRSNVFRSFLEALSDKYYKAADKLIVNSLKTKDYFIKELKIPEDKIVFVPQSAEKIYENSVADIDLMDRFAGSFNIVYTGEITAKQSFSTVLKAAEKVLAQGIKKIKFIIVGSGPLAEWFENEVKERNLTDYFFFEGAKLENEIPKYLNMADALLDTRNVNDAEDYYVPSKLASYMAAQKPLILAMGGEAKEIVNYAECGFISEPLDSTTLASNIKKLYEMSRSERAELGRNAKKYQMNHFNRKRNINRLLREIKSTVRETDEEKRERIQKETSNENWMDSDFMKQPWERKKSSAQEKVVLMKKEKDI